MQLNSDLTQPIINPITTPTTITMSRGHKKPKESTFGAPKKNQSSYFIFSNERRAILSKENTGSSVTDISKIISAEWKEMDAETKKKYQTRADEQKQQWLKEYEVFKQTDGYKKYQQALSEWKENEKALGRAGKGKKGKKKAPKKPKQPEAMPKRPQSSYFIFSNKRRNEMKDQYPDKKITELSKLIAEEWKGKSAEAKKIYEDQAAINKEKYHKAIEEYKKTDEYKRYQSDLDDWKKEKKRFENSMDVDSDDDTPKISMPRKPKDDKCPKRPLTSYFLYAKAVREETKTEFPNKPITEIATEISKKWKLLSEEEKKPYNDEASRLKEQYKKDMEEYEGSDAQKEYKRKLEQWKCECDKRKQDAKDKAAKKKARLAAANNKTKKKSPKKKSPTKRRRMQEDSSDSDDSDSDESDSDSSSDDSDSDSDSSSDDSSESSSDSDSSSD